MVIGGTLKMRVKAYTVSLFLLFLLGATAKTQSDKNHPAEEIRNVNVCALVSEKNPVSLENINLLMERASVDYMQNVIMKFTIVEAHTTNLDPKIDLSRANELSRKFRAECSQGEIVLVFSNEKHFILFDNRKQGEVFGLSTRTFGVAWIYTADSRFNATCNISTKMTVEHEIAHLFGAEDDKSGRSLMSRNFDCKDIWPESLRKIILKNKFHTWSPRKPRA